ncbi:hypothetical protein JTB14_022333 [Gonioctena quinquepunctata]|nr:hypothetical protein JTB14_022333 [Gonioctena quinquepunctata]
MRGHNTSYKIPALINQDEVITEDKKIANHLAKYFHGKTILKQNNVPITHKPSQVQTTNSLISDQLNNPFSVEELTEALLSSENSAPGPDDKPFIFLKNLHHSSLQKLLALYNRIWQSLLYGDKQ